MIMIMMARGPAMIPIIVTSGVSGAISLGSALFKVEEAISECLYPFQSYYVCIHLCKGAILLSYFD